MNDLGLRMLLNFQKRMRETGTLEVSAEQYMSALDTALKHLEELKMIHGLPDGLDEEDWIIAYGTARLLITIGYIRGMWDAKAFFRKNEKLNAEICVQMGWTEQQELCSMFEK